LAPGLLYLHFLGKFDTIMELSDYFYLTIVMFEFVQLETPACKSFETVLYFLTCIHEHTLQCSLHPRYLLGNIISHHSFFHDFKGPQW
jgi:hypothetical protein